MSPSAEPYLQAAETTFTGSAELRHHLAGEMRARVEAAGEDSEAALVRATQRLERGGKNRRLRRAGWIAALGVLTLAGLSDAARQCWRDRFGIAIFSDLATDKFSLPDLVGHPYVRELPAQKQLLFPKVLGDDSDPDLYKPLWDSDPGNPLFYYAYAAHYRQGKRALPPDYLETAARLDPGNGYPYFFAAALVSQKAMPTSASSETGTITSRPDLEEALRLLHQAALQPRMEDPWTKLKELQTAALPAPRDLLEGYSTAFLSLSPIDYDFFRIAHLFSAAAADAAAANDGGHYAQASRDWQILAPRLVGNRPGSFASMIFANSLSKPLPAFIAAAKTFGFTQEAARYTELQKGLKDLKALANSRKDDPDLEALKRRKSVEEEFTNTGFWPAAVEDFTPARKTEHAFLQRVLMLLLTTTFLVALGIVACFHFRGGVLSRGLAGQGGRVLSGRSRALACAAAVAPLLAVELYLWLGPSAATAWSLGNAGAVLTVCQGFGAFLLALLLPIIALRRGLRQDADFLHLTTGRSRGLWWAVAGVLAALALLAALPWMPGFDRLFETRGMGWSTFSHLKIEGSIQIPLWIAAALALPALVAVLALVIRAVASSGEKLPGRLAVASALLRPYACALCLTALAQPVLHAMERHYFQSDPLRKPGQSLEDRADRNYAAALRKLLEESEKAGQ